MKLSTILTTGALALTITGSAFAATAHQQPAPTTWVLLEFDATPDASGQPAIVMGLTNVKTLKHCNEDIKLVKIENTGYARFYRCQRMTPADSNRDN